MNNTLTEQKVLKKLGIPDFRHMTKEKVVGFVSMLPHMDPEVAKKALEQFPEFAKTALAITEGLKAEVEALVASNATNTQEFNRACLSILDSLKGELSREGLSEEARANIIDQMLQVASLMSEKDTENKAFHAGLAKCVCFFRVFLVISMAALLGAKAISNWGDDK